MTMLPDKKNRYKITSLPTPGITPLLRNGEQQPALPTVCYSAESLRAIEFLVQQSDDEIAWLGLVKRLDAGMYLITKVFLPQQTVTRASVDIDADAMAKLTLNLMDSGENPEELLYHGHSHVNMAIMPSLTDQDHMADYLEHAPWYIREIRNRKGEFRVDVFDKTAGLTYNCVPTEIFETLQTEDFYRDWKAQLNNQVKKYAFQSGYRYANSIVRERDFLRESGKKSVFDIDDGGSTPTRFLAHSRSLQDVNPIDPDTLDALEADYEELLRDPFFVGAGT